MTRSKFSIMSDIVNNKKGRNIVNYKMVALLISQTAYLLLPPANEVAGR